MTPMGLLHRRHPRYGRPLPFLACLVGIIAGVYYGLHWKFDWSLQTGNLFLLVLIPRSFIPSDPSRLLLLGLAAAGLLGVWGWATMGPSTARSRLRRGATWWARPSFRFYPATLLFGLFLLYFGCAFLFDASIYGDRVPGGYAAFIYLDYAGLLDRPFVTGVGIALTSLGAALLLLAFERGLGGLAALDPVEPPSPGPRPATPQPGPMPLPPSPGPTPGFAPRTAHDTVRWSSRDQSAEADERPRIKVVGVPARRLANENLQ